MIGENEIQQIFGNEVHLEPEILSAVLRFTLAFSYAEHKIMGEFAETKKCGAYATLCSTIGINQLSKDIDYFRCRYTQNSGHEMKLDDLCNGDSHSKSQIIKSLSDNKPSSAELIESMFRICLRLRHNLFHGRKWSYMLADQVDNLNHATAFLIKALRATGN